MLNGWTMGLEGWLFMGAWALVLIVVVWALVHDPHHPSHEEALDTLRTRLARGEINTNEFEKARRLLEP